MFTTKENREFKLVIWDTHTKQNVSYFIDEDTTIQNIIDTLKLTGVCMVLLGHKDYPFMLFPCDYLKHLLEGKTEPTIMDSCTADDYNVKVIDLMMSTPEIRMDLADYISTLDDHSNAEQEAKKIFWNEGPIDDFRLHFFKYNHQEVDLCNIEDGKDGEWSKKDWKLTTNESSLWLQLEKEFLTKGMERNYDWTEATI
jgi:hypothetical protein